MTFLIFLLLCLAGALIVALVGDAYRLNLAQQLLLCALWALVLAAVFP